MSAIQRTADARAGAKGREGALEEQPKPANEVAEDSGRAQAGGLGKTGEHQRLLGRGRAQRCNPRGRRIARRDACELGRAALDDARRPGGAPRQPRKEPRGGARRTRSSCAAKLQGSGIFNFAGWLTTGSIATLNMPRSSVRWTPLTARQLRATCGVADDAEDGDRKTRPRKEDEAACLPFRICY